MRLTIKFRRTSAILLLAASLAACKENAAEAPSSSSEPKISGSSISFVPSSPTVQRLITRPVVAAQQRTLSLPAHIVWDEDHTSRIMPPVAGRLVDVAVQAGTTVKAGQPLAYLTSPDLGSAQTDSARAQTDMAQAERNLSRTRELAEAGVIAGKELEQAQADLVRARAEAARTALRIKSLGAASAVDQRYTLRSPISGVVVERNTNPGMEWRPDQPGVPLFVVSDPTYLWCWIDAPERALGMLKPGMKVTLRSSAWPQEKFEAQIEYIGDALDPLSRTMKVRARLRNTQRHLKGEMYVTAELTGQAHGALDVPVEAVYLNEGVQQVFVKTGEAQFTRKGIAPVATGEKWVSIVQGLNKGDEVVVDGVLYLQQLLDGAAPQPAAAKAVSGAATTVSSADKTPAK